MRRIECPRCGGVAAMAVRKAYCPACSWNREAAEQQLRKELRQVPLVFACLLLLLGLSYLVFGLEWKGLTLGTLVIVFGTLLAAEFLWARRTLRSFPPVDPRAGRKKPPIKFEQLLQAEKRRLAENEAYVASLPRPPRPVRMGRDLKLLVAIFVLPITFVLLGFLVHLGMDPASADEELLIDLLFVGLPVILFGFGIHILRGERRKRRLLVWGHVASGWVTKQRLVEKGASWKGSEIFYQFKDELGRLREGKSNDATESFLAGMPVPVFYEEDDPNTSTAMCGTSFEIVTARKK